MNKIKSSDISKIFPEETYKFSDPELKQKYTEWCCTKYRINEKIYITISIAHPESNKMIYIDANGDQIVFQVDEKYNQYVIEKTYWYGE